jgi:hypothetical protein
MRKSFVTKRIRVGAEGGVEAQPQAKATTHWVSCALDCARLESSGADSSGLTEALLEISGSVDVRLSEQQVVV